MTVNYYVIDDVPSDIEKLVREADKTKILACVGSYTSIDEALNDFRLKRVKRAPVIFCDIRLSDENGLDAGPELARYCKYLVYVTGLPGQKGNVLDAMGDDHLQKPVTRDQLRTRVIDRFFRRYDSEFPLRIHLNKLVVTEDKMEYAIKLKDIRYIKHDQNYLDIVTTKGKKYIARDTVERAFDLLEPAGIFIKVNGGTIINAKQLTAWDNTEVWLDDLSFPVKGKGKENLNNFINRIRLGNGASMGKSS